MGGNAMKKNPSSGDDRDGTFRPFENLRDLLDGRPLECRPSPRMFKTTGSGKRRSEAELFADAMADVTPISGADRHAAPDRGRTRRPVKRETGDGRVLEQLRRLVTEGHGFEVSHTSEYMEGRGYNVSREVTRRLYNGDFSIQDHIDLHGLTAAEAREAFFAFMDAAIARGRRAVLIVHGRGLSSPSRPVLKRKVFSWLTRSAIRKWVIAFTSARTCDGGAGATYVLLRLRPVTKRHRKGARKNTG
jgi:DNA-nicking Smr family endonuclease